MIITFVGHRQVFKEDEVREWVRRCILSANASSLTFFCGGYGAFDRLCASVCGDLKEKLAQSEIVYVTPYLDRAPDFSALYDTVLYPPLEGVPRRYAIVQRNRYMIEKADLVLSYILHPHGGAYQSFLYARRLGKRILQWGEGEK